MSAALPTTRALIAADDVAIMAMWKRGMNTQTIADALMLKEHQVERLLHRLKDEDRQRKAQAE